LKKQLALVREIEVRPERVNGPISRSKFSRETVLVSYIDDQYQANNRLLKRKDQYMLEVEAHRQNAQYDN
jgi:hypothetical protein